MINRCVTDIVSLIAPDVLVQKVRFLGQEIEIVVLYFCGNYGEVAVIID